MCSLIRFLRLSPALRLALLAGATWLGADALRAAQAPELLSSVPRGQLRGVLVPSETVYLSAREPGVIEKFGADEGDHVVKDQLLVQLNADVQKAELTRAEAVLETAVNEEQRAKREMERTKNLFEGTPPSGSLKDVEDAVSVHQIRMGQRKQAEAEVLLAKAHLRERAIYATFDGVLFRRTHVIGEAVERLESVVRVINASKLEFVVYGGADLTGRFKAGQSVRILVESGAGRNTEISGVVSYVDPTMDPETSTFRVKISVEPSEKVQSGISVLLQLPSEVN